MSDVFTPDEERRLVDLYHKAERAGMSVWAYAVHTGRAADLQLATVYRAMTDTDFCVGVFRRQLGVRWVDLTVVLTRPPRVC